MSSRVVSSPTKYSNIRVWLSNPNYEPTFNGKIRNYIYRESGKLKIFLILTLLNILSAPTGKWRKVFRHLTNNGHLFDSSSVLRVNAGNEESNIFSILDSLDNYKTGEGKYHFMLCYDGVVQGVDGRRCNEWIQTSNPATSNTVTGYEEIFLAFTQSAGVAFQGLARSSTTSHCFIDSSPGSDYWWMCVGAFNFNSYRKIPGPLTVDTFLVQLYMNVDHME